MNNEILIFAGILLLIAVIVRLLSSSRKPEKKSNNPELSDQLAKEIENHLAKGHKIEAIKLVRKNTGLGLKEAKEYVESLKKGN